PHSLRDYDYWPSNPSAFREIVYNYSEETFKLVKRLLGAFSINLDLPQTYLEKSTMEPYQNMLINYYPPCPQPELTAGFYAHSNIGMATLLLQETGSKALQVRKNDKSTDYIKHIITNGRYKSVEHRVVVEKEKPRISIPIFCDAAPKAIIKPAPELLQKNMEDKTTEVEKNDRKQGQIF
ncbi:hypothetical protein KI387_030601, partial [Taxus chinensis]